MSDFHPKQVRADFPMIREKEMNGYPLIYFDSAATAQKPDIVIDTMTDFYRNSYATVNRGVYPLSVQVTDRYHQVRKEVQQFIGAASPSEIIFTKGTTEGINLIAYSYGDTLSPGDEIIISEMEHHSNIVPWQLLAKRKKVVIRYMPLLETGQIDLNRFESLLSTKTKLVSVAHVSNVVGTVHPIQEIADLAHAKGAKVLIDGAQSVPHIPLNLESMNIDFYVFSGHKLYGPTGVGVLYGKESVMQELAPFLGGGDMIEAVQLHHSTFQPPPLRFEGGTPPIAEVIGLGAAISYLKGIGMRQIAHYETYLTDYALGKLSGIPEIELIGNPKKRGPVISFALRGVHPLDLGTLVGLKGLALRTGHLCAQPFLQFMKREQLVRISFGIYNTTQEIDRAIDLIREGMLVLNPDCLG